MIKDIVIHFKKEDYGYENYKRNIWAGLIVVAIFAIDVLIILSLAKYNVAVNLIVVCVVSLTALMYTLTKPISREIDDKFVEKAYSKAKIQAEKVEVRNCNETVNSLVEKGYVIDKVSTMGTEHVLITYYVPISKEEEAKRSAILKEPIKYDEVEQVVQTKS